jgi:uncharacterized protein with GYD domain
MPTYILLPKLSSGMMSDADTRENLGREWMNTVKDKCPNVKWLEHYALLGSYDFMDIYEAPNEEEAAKVSMITMMKGAVKAESLTAIPYKRYMDLIKEL